MFSDLANYFLLRMDTLALELLHTNEQEVGIFSLLLFIPSLVWMNFSSVSNVISPKISELDKDEKELQKLFDKSFRFLILSNLMVAGGIAIFADPILNWFHADMLGYKNWLYFLLAGAALNRSLEVASPFLRFGGYHDTSAKVANFILMANLAVTPLSILFYGIEGAITALVSMRFVRGMSYMYCVRRYIGLKPLGVF